jgi:hypothetical protein
MFNLKILFGCNHTKKERNIIKIFSISKLILLYLWLNFQKSKVKYWEIIHKSMQKVGLETHVQVS